MVRWASRALAAPALFAAPIVSFVAIVIGAGVASTGVLAPWRGDVADYLAGLSAAIFFAAVIVIVPIQAADRLLLLLGWILKSAIALALMLAYEAQYDFLDAYSYYGDARFGAYTGGDLSLGAGTEAITYVLQMFYLVLPPSYHMSKVIFAFIGLIGLYLAFRGWATYRDDRTHRMLIILTLFPGLLFWSSILGKEPVLIFAVGLYIFGLAKFFKGHGSGYIGYVILAVVIAGFIRPWMAVILSIAMTVGVLAGIKDRIKRLGATASSVVLVMLFGSLVVNMLDLDIINQISRGWSEGGSAQDVPQFLSYGELLQFLPTGAFAALFRPLPGEVLNAFGLFASLENVLLLGALLTGAVCWRLHFLRDRLYLVLLALVVMWAAMYGVVSYQNLGTAVRFKAQILPALLILLWWPFARKQADNDKTGRPAE